MITKIRKNRLPAAYPGLGWIRRMPITMADCPEDLGLIRDYQIAFSSEDCISYFDGDNEFILLIEAPDDFLSLEGKSERPIVILQYYWKVDDVLYLVLGSRPGEAVDTAELNLNNHQLVNLCNETSCIKLLDDLQNSRIVEMIKQGDMNTIKEYDDQQIAYIRLQRLKGSSHRLKSLSVKNPAKKTLGIDARERKRILERDHYTCIFCSQNGTGVTLHVDHIIPRSLVSKLELDAVLNTAEYNLATTCASCNIGKGDMLSKEDIAYYRSKFKSEDHPNHSILKYLDIIRDLQRI